MQNYRGHGIGARFEAATLASVSAEDFAEVHEYAQKGLSYTRAGRGLLLSGNPGIGKTWAMVALMRHLFALYGDSPSRWDFHMVTAPTLFDLYHPDSRDVVKMDEYRDQAWVKTFETVHGLVINDLGKEDRSREWHADAVTYKLGRVLRARHEAQLPIYITTNLALKSPTGLDDTTVRATYGESIWSLLQDMTQFRVQTVAPDRRITPLKD
jgi:DNA replication protein DnaC